MNYQGKHSNWHYSVLAIPNLPLMQAQLLSYFWSVVSVAPTGSAFISFSFYDHTIQWQKLTYLTSWLKNHGIDSRDKAGFFSVLNHGSVIPIHVDYTDRTNFISINIPLLNCNNSYTVWYDADIDFDQRIRETQPFGEPKRLLMLDELSQNLTGHLSDSFWCKQQGAVEVDRVESNQPLLVNISVPHRPVVNHDQLRVLFALRLRPELSPQELARLSLQSPLFD